MTVLQLTTTSQSTRQTNNSPRKRARFNKVTNMQHVIPFAVLSLCIFPGIVFCRNIQGQNVTSNHVTTTQSVGLVDHHEPAVDENALYAPYHGAYCGKKLDIVLMMDASTSIGETTFDKVKRFSRKFVGRFEVKPDVARFGAMRFNKYSWVDFNLNTFSRRADVRAAINDMEGVRIGSRNGHAFKIARQLAFKSENGDRADIPNIVVLITDGRSSFPDWTMKEAQLIKDAGAKVFAIGMGGRIDHDELNFISSGPSYTFVVKDGDNLRPILADLVEAVCDEAGPPNPENGMCQFADVALVLDASSSIGPSNLEILKEFSQDELLNHFDIGPDWVNVALVKYNKYAQTIFHLDTYTSPSDVSNAVAAVSGTEIGTRTGHAMKIVRGEVFVEENGDRPDAPNVVILLTDGRSSFPDWTFQEAGLVKNAGASIFAIGFGRTDDDELKLTASNPESKYVHYGDNFQGLQQIISDFAMVPCDETCALADVALVMDASSSIGPGDLEIMKTFLQGLLLHFDIGPDRVNVGLVKYNKYAETVFSLNTYTNRNDVSNAVAAVSGTEIGTRTGHAMKIVRNEVFVEANGDRPDVPNVVILLTDGRSTFPDWTFQEAALLKNAGVSIFAIGIGGRIDADELIQTASSPADVYLHYVDDFHGLEHILNEFAGFVCDATHRTQV